MCWPRTSKGKQHTITSLMDGDIRQIKKINLQKKPKDLQKKN